MNIARTRLPRIAAFRALSLSVLTASAIVGCQKVPLLAPTGSTMTLISTATSLPINGTTQLIAQVLEAKGTPPHSGTQVIFTTTLGTIEPATAETDVDGRAIVTFKAGTTSGTATITASSGAASVTGTSAVKIAIGAAAAASLSVSASPTVVSSSGGSSTIIAQVFDNGANALALVPVTFTTDNGSLSASVASTDASGKAQITLTTNRTAKVTATAGVATTTSGGSGGSGGTTTTSPVSASVTVTVNSTASITVGPVTPANPTVGQTVSIPLTYPTGAAGTSPITSVKVDWGDGRTQTYNGQPTVITHAYGAPGSYLVAITGIDSFGDSTSTSAAVTVANAPKPTVSITTSTSNPVAGSTVVFSITATATPGNSITSIMIDYGDGSQQTLQGNATSVSHVYAQAATYTVTAVATDSSGQTGSGTTVIVVGTTIPAPTPAPTANFTFSPSNPGHGAANPVQFNGSTSTGSGLTYSWDFGDAASAPNNTATGVSPTHAFSAAGTFTVTLTVTDSSGRTAVSSKQVTAS